MSTTVVEHKVTEKKMIFTIITLVLVFLSVTLRDQTCTLHDRSVRVMFTVP